MGTVQRTRGELVELVDRAPADAMPQPAVHIGRTDWETGPRRAVVGHYVFVDVPGPHTVAIWSWVAKGNAAAFDVNDELIGNLRFNPAG